jgi:hypothetical protein
MDISFSIDKQSELGALVDRLDKAWARIPAEKEPLYLAVFWIARYANEMLEAYSESGAGTISLRYRLADALKRRVSGFGSQFKLDRASALAEIDRVSTKLKSLGYHTLDMPMVDYMAKCDKYANDYREFRMRLSSEGDA